MSQKRSIWLDNTKVFACILVTLGHFVQSMVKSGFLAPADWEFWFNNTIYYFHVPLFFVCSGYLYQRHSRIRGFDSWKNHVLKKAVNLGIPFLVFSLITWLLKALFSSAVNVGNSGLLEALFLVPAPPYWYMYVLFFLFAIIPTFRNSLTLLTAFAITVICKLTIGFAGKPPVYLLAQLLDNGVWFVGGMALAGTGILKRCRSGLPGLVLAAVFLVLSLFAWKLPLQQLVPFVMGILGCAATIMIMKPCFSGRKSHPVWAWMAKYTMPVFLMHTIFSAGWRVVLLKLGVTSAPVHILTGLVVSFAGPILAAWIMGKIKGLDFVMYPGKYLRLGSKTPSAKR